MHRATERRWVNVCLFVLAIAWLCQLLGFVLPAWVRLHGSYNVTHGRFTATRNFSRDYALWYMTQCNDQWECKTESYYQLFDWTRGDISFDQIKLDIPFYKLHDAQVLYSFGLLGSLLALLPLWRRRQQIVSKRAQGEPTKTGFLIAGALTSLCGLFVMVAAGLVGIAGDMAGARSGFRTFRPTGIGLAAAGGTLTFVIGLVIFARITLKRYCPDCVSVSRETDVTTRETGNQVEVMVYAETAE